MRRIALAALAALCVPLLVGCAGSRIDGVYMLVERHLPDGTVQTPPTVNGLLTYDEGMRNFNVHWTDARGRHVSTSSIARFTITEYEYSESNVFYQSTEGGSALYDLSPATASSEIVYTERGMRFTLPLHNEPVIEFGDDGFTATRAGSFVDHWRKVGAVRRDEAKAAEAERRAAEEARRAEERAAQEAAQAEEPQPQK